MLETVVIAVAAALAALVVRAIALFVNRGVYRQGFVGDAAIHLAIIRQLRRDARSRYVEQYMIRYEPMSYPTAFHRYCAIFPMETLVRRPYLPSLVLFVLAVSCFGLWFRHVALDLAGQTGLAPVTIAVAAFLLTPGSFTFVGPGVAYICLSERFLARLSCAAFVAAAFAATQWADPWSMAIAVVAAAVAFLVALFARQAVLFVAPVMALLMGSPMPLWLMLAGLILALAISRRYFVLSMWHMLVQWRLYATHAKRSAQIRANLAGFFSLAEIMRLAKEPLRLGWYLLNKEPQKALLFHPEIMIALVLLAYAAHVGVAVAGIGAWPLGAPILAAVVVYLLTAAPWLDHLGECYRYLEYGTYFMVPLVFGLAWQGLGAEPTTIALAALAAADLVVLGVVHGIYYRFVRWPARDELADFIADMNLPEGAVVYPIPIFIAGHVCARRADAKSFWYQPGLISTAIFRDFFEDFPFLKCDAGPIIDRYGVTHAICDKTALKTMPAACRLPGMERVCESDRFIGFARIPPDRRANDEAVAVIEPLGQAA